MKTDSSQSFYRRFIMRALAAFGIAAAILVSWWMRVENARHKDEIPIAVLGDRIDLGQNVLTPHSLRLEQSETGDSRLVLRARVENRTGQTQGAVFGFPPKPPQLEMADFQLGNPETILDRDAESLGSLQPRMPEDVTIIWQVPSQWRPDTIELTFFRQIFKLRDNLYGQSSWLGFEPSMRLSVPMEKQHDG